MPVTVVDGPVLELTDEPGKGKGKFDASIRYYKEMEDGIAGAIIEANSKLVPAKMAIGSVQLQGFNRNRHTKSNPNQVIAISKSCGLMMIPASRSPL